MLASAARQDKTHKMQQQQHNQGRVVSGRVKLGQCHICAAGRLHWQTAQGPIVCLCTSPLKRITQPLTVSRLHLCSNLHQLLLLVDTASPANINCSSSGRSHAPQAACKRQHGRCCVLVAAPCHQEVVQHLVAGQCISRGAALVAEAGCADQPVNNNLQASERQTIQKQTQMG